jgi:hypothetical protein
MDCKVQISPCSITLFSEKKLTMDPSLQEELDFLVKCLELEGSISGVKVDVQGLLGPEESTESGSNEETKKKSRKGKESKQPKEKTKESKQSTRKKKRRF